jgi:hypothetical protein
VTKLGQFANAQTPMVVTVDGIETSTIEVQYQNACLAIDTVSGFIVMCEAPLHSTQVLQKVVSASTGFTPSKMSNKTKMLEMIKRPDFFFRVLEHV